MLDKNNKPYPEHVTEAINRARSAAAQLENICASRVKIGRLRDTLDRLDSAAHDHLVHAVHNINSAYSAYAKTAATKEQEAVDAISKYEARLIIFPPPEEER